MGDFELNSSVRYPAVAGLFYPADAAELRANIETLLENANSVSVPTPKALIVPHAGYPYSGPVAAVAYRLLQTLREEIRRVVLIGPSHRVYFEGVAVARGRSFATPLGEIEIDAVGRMGLLETGLVHASDTPHLLEHCLEVQLPFLQCVLDGFELLPLVVGASSASQVASVLEQVWEMPQTLVLASSDLSHYHSYDSAQRIDAATARAIVDLQSDIKHEHACGAQAINGLLTLARRKGLEVTEIARQNSGDTSGDLKRVVGYGAFAIHARRQRPQ